MPKQRIQSIDTLRGVSILLMVLYHLGFDLVVRGILPAVLIQNPLMFVLQTFFAGVFVTLCGVSCRFSRSNLRRGLALAGCALLVTAASLVVLPNPWEALMVSLRPSIAPEHPHVFDNGAPITMGILHLLAACVLLLTLLQKLKIDRLIVPLTLIAGFGLIYAGVKKFPAFYSGDSFPLFPWWMLFALGWLLGEPIFAHKFPAWFYRPTSLRFVPWIGRKTLWVYLLHQPVFYAVFWVLDQISA